MKHKTTGMAGVVRVAAWETLSANKLEVLVVDSQGTGLRVGGVYTFERDSLEPIDHIA